MMILARILQLGSYSVLMYIGWLLFDFYVTNKDKSEFKDNNKKNKIK